MARKPSWEPTPEYAAFTVSEFERRRGRKLTPAQVAAGAAYLRKLWKRMAGIAWAGPMRRKVIYAGTGCVLFNDGVLDRMTGARLTWGEHGRP